MNERCTLLAGTKKITKNRIGMNAKQELYERIVLITAYGSELQGMKVTKRKKINVFSIKSLGSMISVAWRDRIWNKSIHIRKGVLREMICRVDMNILSCLAKI